VIPLNNYNCTPVYIFYLTINPLSLLNFDFWFLHEIFCSRIKAKILSFNSLPLFPWIPWFYILFLYSWKPYHMYFVFLYLIPKFSGQRLRIIHTIRSNLKGKFLILLIKNLDSFLGKAFLTMLIAITQRTEYFDYQFDLTH
jgi:hypothetical protein